MELFIIETLGKGLKCSCGIKMAKGTKQLKILSCSRWGLSYAYICHNCAQREVEIIKDKLCKLKKEL